MRDLGSWSDNKELSSRTNTISWNSLKKKKKKKKEKEETGAVLCEAHPFPINICPRFCFYVSIVLLFLCFHCSYYVLWWYKSIDYYNNILQRKMSIFFYANCLFFNWFHRDLEKICLWSKLGCAPFAGCSVLPRRPLLKATMDGFSFTSL